MKQLLGKSLALVSIVTVGLALSGCPKKPAVKDDTTTGSEVPAQSGAGTGSTGGGDTAAQTGAATPFDANGGSAMSAALSGKIIYFDYDKIEIKSEYTAIVADAARSLVAHSTWKVRLEGNTDQRGTREYNIGLGERRAQAVRRALLLQGAAESQITTVSYGEERPAAEGEDEGSFARNRRVELVANP